MLEGGVIRQLLEEKWKTFARVSFMYMPKGFIAPAGQWFLVRGLQNDCFSNLYKFCNTFDCYFYDYKMDKFLSHFCNLLFVSICVR